MKTYATLGQLKAPGYLDITNNDYDDTLLRMLENASEDIDHLCFRHFDCLEETIYCDGAGRILLPPEDILSISEIKLDLDGSQGWATTLTSGNYFLYPLIGWPKMWLKMSLNCGAGTFASGIPSGVKITGIFGHGDGQSATPYISTGVTVNTSGISNSETSHVLASGLGDSFSPGLTLRIDSEQIYVNAVNGDTLGITRAVNGTTAAAHLAGAIIYTYRYPGPVVESTLLLATNWWKQRENPTVFKAGNSITGEYEITEDIEKILTKRLNHHIKRKL